MTKTFNEISKIPPPKTKSDGTFICGKCKKPMTAEHKCKQNIIGIIFRKKK